MASAAKWVQAAAGVLECSGGRRELATPFMSWKSRVIQMAPLKHLDGLVQRGAGLLCQPLPSCLHPCCSWRYRRDCFGGFDPGNQRDFKTPAAALWTGLVSVRCQGAAVAPRAEEIKRCGKVVHAFHAMFVNQCSPNAPWLALALQVAVQDAANSRAS